MSADALNVLKESSWGRSGGAWSPGADDVRWWLAAAIGSIVVGATAAVDPAVGLVTAALPLVLVAAVLSARARLMIVLAGGLLVFQSQSLAGFKFGYLAVALLCTAVSGLRLARSDDPALRAFRPLLGGSAGLIALIGASALVAKSNGGLFDNWVRDALPYLLVAVLPVVGLDAGNDLTPRAAELLIALVGLVGAAGMAVDWLHRRDVSSLAVDRFILSSNSLVGLGFALAITRAALGPNRLRWVLMAVGIVTLMLTTGSRGNVAVLFAVLGVIGASRKFRVSLIRAGTAILVTVGAVVITLPWLVQRLTVGPNFLSTRVTDALLVLNGDGSSDLSYLARQQAYQQANEQFQGHLLLGTGPGYLYPSGAFTLDTPMLTLAKWGLLGSGVLAAYLLALAACFIRVRRLAGYSPISTVARSWCVALIAWIPLGTWLEDKGFALAVTLLAAAAIASARKTSHTAPGQTTLLLEPSIHDRSLRPLPR